MSNFEYWERHPEAEAVHDAFFTAMARLTTRPLVAAYDLVFFLSSVVLPAWPVAVLPYRSLLPTAA